MCKTTLFKILRPLLLIIVATVSYAAEPTAAVPPDPCEPIKKQISELHAKLMKAQADLVAPFGHPGEPLKPQKNPAGEAKIKQIKGEIADAEAEFAKCEVPPPTPLLTIPAFTPGVGVPDPQIAVGRKYIVAYSTSYLKFYDKATLQPLSGISQLVYDNPLGATSLFKNLFPQLNKALKLPKNVCDTMKPPGVFDSGFDPTNTDPKHPGTIIPGCINEAYDTRVVYDDARHRFWIEAAVRNELWACPPPPPGPHASIGGYKSPPNGPLIDPDPTDPTKSKCHMDWNGSWAHRIIVVAVSQVDANGDEDLSRPFHVYALVDDLKDWPLMIVHGNYLLLTHKETGSKIEVFDAEALANGQQDNSALAVKPLSNISLESGAWLASEQKNIVPTGSTSPVTIHGDSGRITYLVSSEDNFLTVHGFRAPANDLSGKPEMLTGAAIKLGPGHNLRDIRHNPVFRNGKIYLATSECKVWVTTETAPNQQPACQKAFARIMAVPVRTSPDGKSVELFGPGSPGFMDYSVGDDSSTLSNEIAGIEVTSDNDLVLMFEQVGLDPAHAVPASAHYAVFFHDRGNISPDRPLKDAVGKEIPSVPDPSASGVIDLGAIVVDPVDGKVWMSLAYSNNGHYTDVMGAVKP